MKKLITTLCLLATLVLPTVAFAEVKPEVADLAHRNVVVIYTHYENPPQPPVPPKNQIVKFIEDVFFPSLKSNPVINGRARGAGTVYYIDRDSTWILTAAHLKDASANQPDHFYVDFEDGTEREGFVSMCFTKSDIMIIHVPGIVWGSYSGIKPLSTNEEVFTFKWQAIFDCGGNFDCMTPKFKNFDDKQMTKEIMEGTINSEPGIGGLGGYQSGDFVRFWFFRHCTITTHPGMSGEGIFDKDGYLVAVANGCCNPLGSSVTPVEEAIAYEALGPSASWVPWIPGNTHSIWF
jgi:hypothetical protein